MLASLKKSVCVVNNRVCVNTAAAAVRHRACAQQTPLPLRGGGAAAHHHQSRGLSHHHRRRSVAVAAQMASSDEAIRVVQRQLEAYNARDLEAFMAVFADDVAAVDAETGAPIASSAAELRPRYEARFKTPVHCELIGRMACGDTVVDRERITGLPDGASADCMAVYTVKGGKIARMQLLWRPHS